ncbi:MAG: NAD-dependent deacetylase [Rhodospirillaceae bacterium]|nr:NAD-dependent deacetylase [Rhodospirillaceae bacterium]
MKNNFGKVKDLKQVIQDSKPSVFFTGAGISTDSGIPDFRSPRGVWNKYKPIQYKEFLLSKDARRVSWERKFQDVHKIDSAKPNEAHHAITKLVSQKKISAVITQNIDALHQASGTPNEKVIELHGNNSYAICLNCGQRHELEPIKLEFKGRGKLPHCCKCGGLVKLGTISFGQPMPEVPMRRAREETLSCNCFVVVGSSLQVYPAAGFVKLAQRKGAYLAIINRDATPLDGLADMILRKEIGPTLSELANIN